MQPVTIEIFKAGKHRPMNGPAISFTQADVAAIALAFDPDKTPVPVVVGHPKTDHPAYAWAASVFVENGVLKATLKDVDPAFAQIVKAGRYKRISAAFHAPDADSNPVQGQYSLRHIGFLGAAAPAVKGLKEVAFSDGGDWVAFAEPSASAIEARYKTMMRLVDNERKVTALVDEGRVLPRDKDDVLGFMASLANATELTFCGDGPAQTQGEWFAAFLARQPVVVPFGRIVDNRPDSGVPEPAFAAPEGYTVDREDMALHAQASRIARDKGVTFVEALDMVDGG